MVLKQEKAAEIKYNCKLDYEYLGIMAHNLVYRIKSKFWSPVLLLVLQRGHMCILIGLAVSVNRKL